MTHQVKQKGIDYGSLPATMAFQRMRCQHLTTATNVPDSTLCYNVNITAKQSSNSLEHIQNQNC